MAIDTTPSSVATAALQSLPFDTLIGGPLNAAIGAQAQAAMTTANFINAVGVTTVNGQEQAVTVTFTYQDGWGYTRTLIVPMITILPIPFIGVDLITIDFKANINASASTSETTSSSSELGGSASVGGSFWGITANFSANYSSKKDSKATAESKYSVEYTMDVHVQASQSDMPAGLAKVLQILQDGITMNSTPPGGQLDFVIPNNTIDSSSSTMTAGVTVIATDATGKPLDGWTLTASLPQGSQLSIDTAGKSIGQDGTCALTVTLTKPAAPATVTKGSQSLTITATPPSTGTGTATSNSFNIVVS